MPFASRLGFIVILVALVSGACATTVEIELPEAGSLVPAERSGPDALPSGDNVVTAARFAWTDSNCEFNEPSEVSSACGWLEVPEHWDDVDDPDTLRLHVGVFSAGPTDTAPIVYLEGGPGGDALANIDQGFEQLFGGLVDQHDIVIIGQRGTGSAEPTLSCPTVSELEIDLLDEALDADAETAAYEEAYVACARSFHSSDIDPSAYNSVQNAHDVEALRQALGHEEWNVLGISYGTRLAQTLMRLHPDGIHVAILDSVLAYEREPSVDIPTTAERAFGQLFAGCEESTICSERFPDLENRFFALVDRLDAEPVSFQVADIISGEQFPAALNGTGLIETTFGALYSKSGFAALPELVEQLEAGDTSGAETFVSQEITSSAFFAEGMYWAVECREEIPFLSAGDTEAGRTGNEYYDRMSPDGTDAFFAAVCGTLDTGVAPSIEDELLVSDIPTLLLAGEYDPITPPADTESLLAGLVNGHYVEFAHTGHAALVDECAQSLTLAFIADSAAPLDETCVSEVEEPDWVPNLFSDLEFETFSYDEGVVSASGVAPVGWEAGSEGSFVLGDNSLHVSVILQQTIEGVPPRLLVNSISSVVGTDALELEPTTVGARTWSHHELSIPGSVIDMFVAEDADITLLVLFQHAPADRTAALAALTEPILSAARR